VFIQTNCLIWLLLSFAVDFLVVVEPSQFNFIHHFFAFINRHEAASLVQAWMLRILSVLHRQIIREHCQEHADNNSPSHEELRDIGWQPRVRFETSGILPPLLTFSCLYGAPHTAFDLLGIVNWRHFILCACHDEHIARHFAKLFCGD